MARSIVSRNSSDDIHVLGQVVGAEILLILFIFAAGVTTQNEFLPLLNALVVGPLSYLSYLYYSTKKTFLIIRKAKRFHLLVIKSSDLLQKKEFEKFDKTFVPQKELLSSGSVNPFLSAVHRLLMQAKWLVLYEKNRRDVSFWSEKAYASNLHKITDSLTMVAAAVKTQDQISAYQNIGEIYLSALRARFAKKQKLNKKSKKKKIHLQKIIKLHESWFVQDCIDLSEYLKLSDLDAAEEFLNEIFTRLQTQSSKDQEVFGFAWQALIILWIRVRFLGFTGRHRRRTKSLVTEVKEFLWVGPSKLLALQILRVTDAYLAGDVLGVVEQITDSFDVRAIVFRNFSEYLVRFQDLVSENSFLRRFSKIFTTYL